MTGGTEMPGLGHYRDGGVRHHIPDHPGLVRVEAARRDLASRHNGNPTLPEPRAGTAGDPKRVIDLASPIDRGGSGGTPRHPKDPILLGQLNRIDRPLRPVEGHVDADAEEGGGLDHFLIQFEAIGGKEDVMVRESFPDTLHHNDEIGVEG